MNKGIIDQINDVRRYSVLTEHKLRCAIERCEKEAEEADIAFKKKLDDVKLEIVSMTFRGFTLRWINGTLYDSSKIRTDEHKDSKDTGTNKGSEPNA